MLIVVVCAQAVVLLPWPPCCTTRSSARRSSASRWRPSAPAATSKARCSSSMYYVSTAAVVYCTHYCSQKRVIDKGLVSDGRIARLRVVIKESQFAKVTGIISKSRANVSPRLCCGCSNDVISLVLLFAVVLCRFARWRRSARSCPMRWWATRSRRLRWRFAATTTSRRSWRRSRLRVSALACVPFDVADCVCVRIQASKRRSSTEAIATMKLCCVVIMIVFRLD